MTLHEKLEHHMKLNKLSKAELARKIDKPYSTIDNWFKRNSYPSSETIEKLANALNVTTEYLLTENETSCITQNLSSEEQQLLTYYCAASEEGKDRIMEQAEFLSLKYPAITKNSNEKNS